MFFRKLSDGLFLKTVLDVAQDYPKIEVNDMIVDNCSMQIVSHPEKFDVIITPNLYGNIVTNIICGLLGGPGLISGQNYSDTCAVFECASRHISFEGIIKSYNFIFLFIVQLKINLSFM